MLHVVVHPPEPCLEHHDRPVQLGEVAPFLSRWYPFHVLEILFQRSVAAPLVGGHLCRRCKVVFHEAPQGGRICTWDDPGVEPAHLPPAFFLYAHHNELLVGVLPAADALLLLPEDRLVHLHRSGHWVFARALHGPDHLPLEPPAGLLPQPELAGELGGGEPLLVGRYKVYDVEGLAQVELDLMEEGARCGRLNIAASRALPGVRRRPIAALPVPASWAFVAIPPFKLGQVGKAAVGVREFILKVEKGHALKSLLHDLNICFPEFTAFIVIG